MAATTQPIRTSAQQLTPTGIASFPIGTTQLTQATLATQPVRPPEVIHRLTFSSENIKRLTADDFDINAKELVTLKYDDCILVLFHVENTESYQLADIWALVAQQVAGPIFGAINMLNERRVAEAFTRLKSDGSHPLHWAAIRQYPFIMVYRKRWPVAVYNGPREVQALIDYALTLACGAGYYEPLQIGGSMQGEGRIEMGPYGVYTNISGSPPVVRTGSLEYNASEPIRGFNPNIPIVVTGSPTAIAATNAVRSEELRQQQAAAQGITTSLTQNEGQVPVPPPGLVGEQPVPGAIFQPTIVPTPQTGPGLVGEQQVPGTTFQPTIAPTPQTGPVPVPQPTTSNVTGLPPPTTVTPQPAAPIALPANR